MLSFLCKSSFIMSEKHVDFSRPESLLLISLRCLFSHDSISLQPELLDDHQLGCNMSNRTVHTLCWLAASYGSATLYLDSSLSSSQACIGLYRPSSVESCLAYLAVLRLTVAYKLRQCCPSPDELVYCVQTAKTSPNFYNNQYSNTIAGIIVFLH